MDENEKNLLKTKSQEFCEEIVRKSFHNVQEKHLLEQCAKDANLIVDNLIIKLSQTNIKNSTNENEEDKLCINQNEELSIDQPHWLRIDDFTIEMGIKKIEEYIKTWKRSECWLYYISFLCEDEYQFSKRYRYKVQWSIPTRRKPIPRATAAVYFTIEASTVKPKHFPCQVYFIFETSKLVHSRKNLVILDPVVLMCIKYRPGQTTFREKWLKDIIESKIFMMETVTF